MTVLRDPALAAGERSDDDASDRERISLRGKRAERQSWDNLGIRSFQVLPPPSQAGCTRRHEARSKDVRSFRLCPSDDRHFLPASFRCLELGGGTPWEGDDVGDDRLFRSLRSSTDGAVDTRSYVAVNTPAAADVDGLTRSPEAASMRARPGQTVLATTLPRSALRLAVRAGC